MIAKIAQSKLAVGSMVTAFAAASPPYAGASVAIAVATAVAVAVASSATAAGINQLNMGKPPSFVHPQNEENPR